MRDMLCVKIFFPLFLAKKVMFPLELRIYLTFFVAYFK